MGDRLQENGWMAILIDAEVTTPGRAETMLKGSRVVTRTRYAHQVTVLANGGGGFSLSVVGNLFGLPPLSSKSTERAD